MAKQTRDNIITNLVELMGEEDTQFVLGVHKNTIYKWTTSASKKDMRTPNSAAQTLAAFYIFLIESCDWTIQEIKDSVETVNERLATYD